MTLVAEASSAEGRAVGDTFRDHRRHLGKEPVA